MTANSEIVIGLKEKLPMFSSSQAPKQLQNDTDLVELICEIFYISDNLDPILSSIADLLAQISSTTESEKQRQSVCLLLRVAAHMLAYYWRVSISGRAPTDDPNACFTFDECSNHALEFESKKKMKEQDQGNIQVHCGYLDSLADPPPLNNRKVMRLLAVMISIFGVDPASIDMDHFPLNWPCQIGTERTAYFFKSCFAGKTRYGVARSLLYLPPNGEELERDIRISSQRVLFFLSSSNWSCVFTCFRASYPNWLAIYSGSSSNNEQSPDERINNIANFGVVANLQHCNLNSGRLQQILDDVNAHMKNTADTPRSIIAVIIRSLISNFMQDFPEELIKLFTTAKNLTETLEPLMEAFSDNVESTRKKSIYWPALLGLFFLAGNIATEHILSDSKKKKTVCAQLFDGLKKNYKGKSHDISVYCYTEFIRAIAITSNYDSLLRPFFRSFGLELADKYLNHAKPISTSKDDENFLTEKQMIELFTCYFQSAGTDIIESTSKAILESNSFPYKHFLFSSLLRLRFADACLKRERVEKSPKRNASIYNLDKERSVASKKASQDDVEKATVLLDILKFWLACPLIALHGLNDAFDFKSLVKELESCITENSNHVGQMAMKLLVRIYEPELVLYWTGTRTFNGKTLPLSNEAYTDMWKHSCMLLKLLAKKIMYTYTGDTDSSNAFVSEIVSMCSHLLAWRNRYIRAYPEYLNIAKTIPERFVTDVCLEMAIMVLLNSIDSSLSRGALLCLQQMVLEGETISTQGDGTEDCSKFAKNLDVYKELLDQLDDAYWLKSPSSKDHNSKIVKVLSSIQHVTPGIMGAWEEIYRRWKMLYGGALASNLLVATTSNSSLSSLGSDDESFHSLKKRLTFRTTKVLATDSSKIDVALGDWLNQCNFLVCMSNLCFKASEINQNSKKLEGQTKNLVPLERFGADLIITKMDINEETALSVEWIKTTLDQLNFSFGQLNNLLDTFLMELLDCIVCDSVSTRESTKDIIGGGMRAEFCVALFKSLQQNLKSLLTEQIALNEKNALMVDACIGLFNHTLKRSADIFEGDILTENSRLSRIRKFSIDLGEMIVHLYMYAKKCISITNSQDELKTKLCTLTTNFIEKENLVGLDRSALVKNYLLKYNMEWNSIFNLKPGELLLWDNRKAGLLDQLTLRTMAKLLKELPMREVVEIGINIELGTNSAENTESNLFLKYFKFFLRALDSFKSNKNISRLVSVEKHIAKLKGETITGLSNLLTANLDLGVKHSIAIAYDEDPILRGIFVQVLTNVMKYGSSTSLLNSLNGKNKSEQEKYKELIDALLDEPYLILQGVAEVSINENENLIPVYLDLFARKGRAIEILGHFAKVEIHGIDDPTCIFRRTSSATRLLSGYVKSKAADFIDRTVGVVLKNVLADATKMSFEIDPLKVGDADQLEANVKSVESLLVQFLERLYSQTGLFSQSLKILCTNIYKMVERKFPKTGRLAIGGLIVLRTICPAILTPEIANEQVTIDKNMKRGLLLCTKVIQNLANNVYFGNKEEHMAKFNNFLKEHRNRFDEFLDELCNTESGDDQVSLAEFTDSQIMLSDCMLHVFIEESRPKLESLHVDKVREFMPPTELDSTEEPLPKNLVQYLWKGQLDKLSILLGALGNVPNLELVRRNLFQRKSSYKDNIELLPGYRNTDLSSKLKKERILFVSSKTSLAKYPVFYYTSRFINFTEYDYNAVLYALLSTIQPYENTTLDLLIDLTGFKAQNDWPESMIEYLAKLIPHDSKSKSKINRVMFLNPNTYFKRAIKRYVSLFPSKHINFELITSLDEISKYIAEENLELHPSTESFLKESLNSFANASLIFPKKKELSATFNVGTTHLNICFNKKQEIVGAQGVLTEIIPFMDIHDVGLYTDPEEKKSVNDIFIRLRDLDSTLYIVSSPQRDSILKTLKTALALSRLANVKVSDGERALLPQDLPGTLLNIAFTNICSNHGALRSAGYALLQEIKFRKERNTDSSSKLLKSPTIPPNSVGFILRISEDMSKTESDLSFEFLMECFSGYPKYSERLQYLSLVYMSPWFENIVRVDAKNSDKPALICQKLVDILVTDPQMENTFFTQSPIWKMFGEHHHLVDILIPVLVERALKFNLDSPQTDTVCSIILSMATETCIASFIQHTRNTLSSLLKENDITKVTESKVWKRINVLMRILANLTFDDLIDSTTNMPHLCFFWILTAGLGSPMKRRTITSAILNVIHCLIEKHPSKKFLVVTAMKLSDPQHNSLFGVEPTASNDFDLSQFPLTGSEAGESIPDSKWDEVSSEEHYYFCSILWDFIICGAPTAGLKVLTIDIGISWKTQLLEQLNSATLELNRACSDRLFSAMALVNDSIESDAAKELLKLLVSIFANYTENRAAILVPLLRSVRTIFEKSTASFNLLPELYWISLLLMLLGESNIYQAAVQLNLSILKRLEAEGSPYKKPNSIHALRSLIKNEATEFFRVLQIDGELNDYMTVTMACLKGLFSGPTKQATNDILIQWLMLESNRNLPTDNNTTETPNFQNLVGFMLLLAPSNKLDKLFQIVGITTARRVRSSVYGGSADQKTIFMIDKFIEVFESQSNSFKFLQLCIMNKMLDLCETEPEVLLLCRILARMAEKYPDRLVPIYQNLTSRLTKVSQKYPNSSISAYVDMVVNSLENQVQKPESEMFHKLDALLYRGIFREAEFTTQPETLSVRAKALYPTVRAILIDGALSRRQSQ